jgi:hypothetical protein
VNGSATRRCDRARPRPRPGLSHGRRRARRLARGGTVILAENESNGSNIGAYIPKEWWQSMAVNGSVLVE